MEAETIDLTDPLEQILKRTNWTPECLNERLSILAQRNVNNRKNKDGIITLNDLLGDYDAADLTASAVSQPFETIELSDDEISDVTENVLNKDYNNETVNEVQVIEVSDLSDQNSCNFGENEDDDCYDEFTYGNSNLNDTSIEIDDNNSHQEEIPPTNDEFQTANTEVSELTQIVSGIDIEQGLDDSNLQQKDPNTVELTSVVSPQMTCDNKARTENVGVENDEGKSLESSKPEPDEVENLENDELEQVASADLDVTKIPDITRSKLSSNVRDQMASFRTGLTQMACDNDNGKLSLEPVCSEIDRVICTTSNETIYVDSDKTELSKDSDRNEEKILAALSQSGIEPTVSTLSQVPHDHFSYIKQDVSVDCKSISSECGDSKVSETTDRDENCLLASSDDSGQKEKPLSTSTESHNESEILGNTTIGNGIIELKRSEVGSQQSNELVMETKSGNSATAFATESETNIEEFNSDRSNSFSTNDNSEHDIASPTAEEKSLESPHKSSISLTNMLHRSYSPELAGSQSSDQSSVENNQATLEEPNRKHAAPSNESSQTSSHNLQEENLNDSSDAVSGKNSDPQDSTSNEAEFEAKTEDPQKQSTPNLLADESNLDQSELHQNVTHFSKEDAENIEESACDIETNFDKLEDIRKHLKLQLTSLRTKKKLDIFQKVKQTIASIDSVKETGSLSNVCDESNSLSNAEDSAEKSESKESTFRTIFEAESGGDAAVIDKTDKPFDLHEDDNVPNVFNEIRKIIRKSKSSSTSFGKTSNDSSSCTNTSPICIQNSDTANEESKTKTMNLEEYPSSVTKKSEGNDFQSKNTVSSPFVSNSLDEFLNDSKLNVSYTIPKCDAEEGLKQNYSVDPIVKYDKKLKEESEGNFKKETKVKAKTLAEKRRLLEKKRKMDQKRLEKSLIKEEQQKRSFVLFKNKKVFVQSKYVGKCFACIESNASNCKVEFPTPVVKKPSLLKELYRKRSFLKYRPGPLSKKYLLQSDYSHWTSELKLLPRVTLSVMPEIGKPIHKNLLPIVSQWNGEITDTQVEFALSALITKTAPDAQIFKFDVNYEKKQEKLLVRRKSSNVANSKPETVTTATNSDPDTDIAQVMENLIKYVEIKEIAPSLIKEDNLIDSTEGPTQLEPPAINQIRKKKTLSKFSRTSKELLRLNCKVVSMEVQENEQNHCSKSFCKFGCVCDSLKCKTMIGLHCRKSICIFGCSCPKESSKIISIGETSVLVNSGKELLSRDTVTRIEGEAKKNLARVEKEFTQTIIRTNDETIVVSTGNKVRRAARAPKKYSDFFDEDIFKDAGSENKKEKKPLVIPCTVSIEKWDFADIMPYCLVHHLYNCYCRGYSTISSLETEKVENIEKDDQPNQNISKKQNYKVRTEESAKLKRKLSNESTGWDSSASETVNSISGRPVRKKKSTHNSDFISHENIMAYVSPESVKTSDYSADHSRDISEYFHCSRTSEIPDRYRSVKTFSNAATSLDFANNINEADVLKLKLVKKEDMLESDRFKADVIKEKRRLFKASTIEHRKKHERKQRIEVRQDEDLNIKTSKPVTYNGLKSRINSVFNGEIIVNDSEWLRKLCNNSKQPLNGGYARILPWPALLKGFLSNSINVYCICDMPLRLLLNVGEKIVRDRVLDIERFGHIILENPLKGQAPWLISQSENVRNIIKWLLSGTLPSKYKATSLSFLLVETLLGQFEVRGLCTQSENTENKGNCDDVRTTTEICDDITEIKHKNMNHEIQSLFITKAKYRMRELVEDGFDDDLTDNLYMWVGLPEVYKVAKWRVIFLKDDFAYLHLKNIKYTIKYTDLLKLTEMAVEENMTLLVRNLQIRRGYDHLLFGLYVTPTYQDRIFIGPYFVIHDEEDVETLRYMNQSLVSSESLNRMKGCTDYKCGHWMYERAYHHPPKNVPKETIDLTSDESVKITPVCRVENKLLSPPPQLSDEQVINHKGFNVHIKNSKPRAPSEFNRYIITNIPHFGYLGAYQPDNSTVLEVSWPFEKKVLQFENADHARDFLQERFNQLLQPVPETFKIQVIVLIHLDLKEHQPINSDFLSGQCICGYFGTYNFRELTDEFCKRELKISKEKITQLFAKRAHEYIRRRIAELAKLAGVDANNKVNYNIEHILARAREEVKLQEQLRIQYIAEIQAKETVVISNIKKLFGMLKKLPAKERNIESKILNEILQIRPKRIGVNEVIEINDDDRTTSTNDEIFRKIGIDEENHESVLKCSKRKIEGTEIIVMPKIAKVESLHSTSITVARTGEQCKTDTVNEVTEKLPASLTR